MQPLMLHQGRQQGFGFGRFPKRTGAIQNNITRQNGLAVPPQLACMIRPAVQDPASQMLGLLDPLCNHCGLCQTLCLAKIELRKVNSIGHRLN